jgi:Flp pilus assembly protein TadD
VLAYDLGRHDDAIESCRRALAQDPLNSPTHHVLGLALYRADRLVEAEEALNKALELAPQRTATRSILALTLLAQGRQEEALAEATAEPALWARFGALAMIHHAMGQGAESDAALRKLIETHGEDSALQVAEVHGARGEVDAAFEWLERAYTNRDPGLSEMKTSPEFRSLHGDPRWRPFLKRMGFEE